jgi:hypothetical protein
MHCRWRGESNGLTNLTHRRGIAPSGHRLAYVFEDLLLAFREHRDSFRELSTDSDGTNLIEQEFASKHLFDSPLTPNVCSIE